MTQGRPRIIELSILTTSGGHVVFFPYGPLIGYVLPSPAFTAIATKVLRRFVTLQWLFVILAILAASSLNMRFELLFCLLFSAAYLLFVFRVRRVTRKLTQLPYRLSAVTFAATVDPEKLYQLQISYSLGTVMAGFLLFFLPFSITYWACLIQLGSRAAMYAYLVHLIPGS